VESLNELMPFFLAIYHDLEKENSTPDQLLAILRNCGAHRGVAIGQIGLGRPLVSKHDEGGVIIWLQNDNAASIFAHFAAVDVNILSHYSELTSPQMKVSFEPSALESFI